MSVLHVFDMDGTLLLGTSASLEIARALGPACETRITALETRLAAEEIDTRQFAAAAYEAWSGLTEATVDEAFARAPWIGNMDRVLADIDRRGERSLVLTAAADFFARRLRARGVHTVIASIFPPLPYAHSGSIAFLPEGALLPHSKIERADRERMRFGYPVEACLAYGDGLTDIPLFATLPHTIAVNATPELEAVAETSYRGANLWDAYQQIRAVLPPQIRDQPAPTGR